MEATASRPTEVDNSHASISDNCEIICWGCGLRLLLSSYSPVFKCGWCGAITNQNQRLRKEDSACFSRWRCIQDRFFVTVLLTFMLFVICFGVWAVYPVIFSVSHSGGILHCILTAILAICTISTFCLAAFCSPGRPADILWGSYPVVVKNGLENYTFCLYCTRPKCPRTHHCRSCKMCVLDMDHHCPFVGKKGAIELFPCEHTTPLLLIGNCVGAANHRYFISFLVSVIISCTYVIAMSIYAGYHIWPPLEYNSVHSLYQVNTIGATRVLKEILAVAISSALLLPARGLVLIYLVMACCSVEIGICVLLWQQLQFIYEGKTYITHISSQNGVYGEKSCQNILRFFRCPYWAFRLHVSLNIGKVQDTSNSKSL